jgi:hypothetical protein
MIKSIGKVTVAAVGTKVRLTATETNPDAHYGCHAVFFVSLVTNTGFVYIGGKNMNVATMTDVWAFLPPSTADVVWSCNIGIPSAPDAVDAKDIYIDAETNGNAVLVTVLVH